ncbi:hypothetical protein Cni_G24758 [Canna indica]|uniref:3'-5' exonuclease domain-containing protein n=1 Tax=Canna indica TaxID=4628 RepID=A0AAQ3QNS8_9LILI|nr:hypothetical protein Cni_G24758 [Canna indica]
MSLQIVEHHQDSYTVIINGSDHVLTTVTASGAKVERWVDKILNTHRCRLHQLVVGLDCEWRPSYSPQQNPVAVLQICVGHRCLIFQLQHADYTPQSLVDFLGDDRFTFVGAGVDGDAQRLQEDEELNVANTLDLRHLAVEKLGRPDLRNAGLARLAEIVMDFRMHKPRRVTMSNWDQMYLTYDQISYACADAFISFEIGRRLRFGVF